MEFLAVKEYDNEAYYTKKFTMSNNIQIDSLITIIKEFESEDIKMSFCHCDTFDIDDHPVSRRYYEVEDIRKIGEEFSPYVSFTVEFCHRENLDYCFSLLANVNSNVLSYVINKKKLSTNMNKSSIRR